MAQVVKHYGGWRARWLDADGKRVSRTFNLKADATAFLCQREAEAQRIGAGLQARPMARRTFAELEAYWMEHRASVKRSDHHDKSIIRRHLRPAFGGLFIDEITVERVDAFAKVFPSSQKTLHNVETLLVSMLHLAVELEWLPKVPRIRKPRIVVGGNDFNYLRTPDELRRFLSAARDAGASVHALYLTALFTGLRAGELAGLRWEDVSFERRLITVQRSYAGPTKAGYVRYVPILDALLGELKAWRLRCPGALVFPSTTGTMLLPSARVFQDTLHDVLRAASFPEVARDGRDRPYITFHGLRHTFASHWMMSGGDLFKLQRIGGWKTAAMVQRYAHLAPEAFALDYARFGAVAVPGGALLAMTR